MKTPIRRSSHRVALRPLLVIWERRAYLVTMFNGRKLLMAFYDRIELRICIYSHSVIVVETPRLVSLKSRRLPVWSLGVCLQGLSTFDIT